ncbi:Sodium/hydrogen exchanger family-domain-containing protein [Dactylonectria estremocensis]|uniref:Sodium/hydrogen exchanger family-domain-containing protein n=1 Tax=Dactylonectria estremocensis TaxID=1079267 RepID=A0A9P9DYF5_9HYPO|nr:Sodium/hydrogen exchanger family-domain-containing protein [Dactylonectria estremocensis]
MPNLNVSELNVVTAVAGGFMVLFGIISVKIKHAWYLGEALPAMLIGICMGPIAANFINAEDWGMKEEGQQREITLGVTRVVICLQLVIAGYQLPAKYVWHHRFEVFMCLIPIMTLMWLLTTGCFLATIPKITFLSGLAIAAAVTCTDPVLSQAVAKGPFADKYVARPLREIISAEACLNDGFGFPFLMLAIYLMRHSQPIPFGYETTIDSHQSDTDYQLMIRSANVGRQGGGTGEALKNWFLECWLYYVIMSAFYGAFIGFTAAKAMKFSLKKRWIDNESYVLFPTALGLFILGTAGAIGTNDLLACAASGCALNWDGEFLAETEERHDEVNTCIDVILNFGGFMYIGTIIPWSEFHDPDGTGVTIWRLFPLGIMVLVLRRIPAILLLYKAMPNVITSWKEALFMGYFGPIGIGAIFYVEHTRHLMPEAGDGDDEEDDLIKALPATIYFLVVFSIIVHGLSIPLLNIIHQNRGVKPIQDDAVSIRRRSVHMAMPPNAVVEDDENVIAYNRFWRPTSIYSGRPRSVVSEGLPFHENEMGESSSSANRTLNPSNDSNDSEDEFEKEKEKEKIPKRRQSEDDLEAARKRLERRVLRYDE